MRWFGVWCEQDGKPGSGHWRGIHNTLKPLQTTRTEAERSAKVLNEGASERTDSVGWRYEARLYQHAGWECPHETLCESFGDCRYGYSA